MCMNMTYMRDAMKRPSQSLCYSRIERVEHHGKNPEELSRKLVQKCANNTVRKCTKPIYIQKDERTPNIKTKKLHIMYSTKLIKTQIMSWGLLFQRT